MYLYEDLSKEEIESSLDKLAAVIVKWNMAVPAIVFLESSKYLNRIGSQFLIFLSPIVSVVFSKWELEKYAVIFEKKENIEYLLDKIEELDAEAVEREKAARILRRKEKKGFLRKIFGKRKGDANGKQ